MELALIGALVIGAVLLATRKKAPDRPPEAPADKPSTALPEPRVPGRATVPTEAIFLAAPDQDELNRHLIEAKTALDNGMITEARFRDLQATYRKRLGQLSALPSPEADMQAVPTPSEVPEAVAPESPWQTIDRLNQEETFKEHQVYLNFRRYFLGDTTWGPSEAREALEQARLNEWVTYEQYLVIFHLINS